jgi:hypothetical protein
VLYIITNTNNFNTTFYRIGIILRDHIFKNIFFQEISKKGFTSRLIKRVNIILFDFYDLFQLLKV